MKYTNKITIEDGAKTKRGVTATVFVSQEMATLLRKGDIICFPHKDDPDPDWLISRGDNYEQVSDWACTITRRVFDKDGIAFWAKFS